MVLPTDERRKHDCRSSRGSWLPEGRQPEHQHPMKFLDRLVGEIVEPATSGLYLEGIPAVLVGDREASALVGGVFPKHRIDNSAERIKELSGCLLVLVECVWSLENVIVGHYSMPR